MKAALLLLALAMPGVAAAADLPECRVRLLAPVTDDRGDRLTAGTVMPADILRRDAGGVSYCAHGGACLPQRVGGREVVRLVNCRPGKAIGGGDYRLDPDPATMGATDRRRFLTARRVENRLSALGFSNAASGSWSQDYAIRPASPDGRLVARALGGSERALRAMKAKRP